MNFYIKTNIEQILLSRLKYVIHFINHHPLKPKDIFFTTQSNGNSVIQYGTEWDGYSEYFIPANKILFTQNDPVYRLYTNTYFIKKDEKVFQLHSVESQKKNQSLFYAEGKFGFDLFETIFFHVSRYEEVHAEDSLKNKAGWLDEQHHLLVKNQMEKRPVIDELIVTFFELISGKPIQFKTKYNLSHDVDILFRFKPAYKFFRSLIASIIHQRGPHQFMGSLRHYLNMLRGRTKDPYDYFDELLSLSYFTDRRFYLMSGGVSKYENNYNLNDPYLKLLIHKAKINKYNFGLHPSYYAGWEEKMFMDEKSTLEKYLDHPIEYSRQHWLRFNWEITPYLIERSGIKEDSSLGYNQRLGYRCGTGFSYHLYDFKNENRFEWLERPLVFMESAALHETNHDPDQLLNLLSSFIQSNKWNTSIEMNFHNSNFDPTLATGRALRNFYSEQLPELISSSNA